MTISYEPMSDVLTITMQAVPVAQSQVQGTVSVAFDAAGAPVSVSIPNASSMLWENGGQISVMLPTTVPAVVPVAAAPAVVRETTTIVERPVSG